MTGLIINLRNFIWILFLYTSFFYHIIASLGFLEGVLWVAAGRAVILLTEVDEARVDEGSLGSVWVISDGLKLPPSCNKIRTKLVTPPQSTSVKTSH